MPGSAEGLAAYCKGPAVSLKERSRPAHKQFTAYNASLTFPFHYVAFRSTERLPVIDPNVGQTDEMGSDVSHTEA